ncbi:DUF317 domain-containing protein [Streptomyces sp. NPDC048275]|uniref:DUF317 domain-containing protein n=1 Tax=Streptomyces sp. NPDC048275 TaxID=3155629 RepID=UPI00340A1169
MRWTSLSADVGIQFDAFATQKPNSPLPTWTMWACRSIDHPTWTVTASPCTPSSLLADLAENLAHGTGTPSPPVCRTPPASWCALWRGTVAAGSPPSGTPPVP